MKNSTLALAILLIFSACSNEPKQATPPTPSTVAIIPDHQPGEIPFDFPIVETISTPAGSTVLTTNIEDLKNAWANPKTAPFTFTGVTLTEPDENASTVTTFTGESYKIPNSLIIPLTSETANEKDILLTWWQGGSGMLHAYTTSKESTSTPVVQYLDDFIPKEELLEQNSFKTLSNELQPGSPVKIKIGNQYQYGKIVNLSEDKALVQEFANNLAVHPLENITAIPLNPKLKISQKVYAPIVGIFQEVTITSLPKNGRVKANYNFANKIEEWEFNITEIVTSLEKAPL